jgi:hypothetical protein
LKKGNCAPTSSGDSSSRAAAFLHRVVLLQNMCAIRRRQKQIAVFFQAQIRRLRIAQMFAEVPDKIRRELGHLHVDRVRELVAHRTGGQRRRGEAVSGVALDHQNRTGEVGILRQKISGRTANRRATDNDNVIAFAGGLGFQTGERHCGLIDFDFCFAITLPWRKIASGIFERQVCPG